MADLDGQIREILGSWQGASSSAYSSACEWWHRGANEVQLGLSILAKAIGMAGLDFQNNESASAARLRGVDDA